MTRTIVWLLVVLLALPAPASAYLTFGVRVAGQSVDVRWGQFPVRYFVTERDVPGVSAAQFRDAIGRAFATWSAVPTATVRAELAGATIAPPGLIDGRTTLGFLDRPELDRVLGSASFLLDASTGAIVEADVFFNTRFDWSVAAAGEPGRIDLESVALHEIGHLLGLGHSALGETERSGNGRRVIASGAVMFPIALAAGSIGDRTLQPDDVAGITALYPAAGATARTGSISGRVTRGGQGVFGAHVAALNLATGDLVGGFALNEQGEFVIASLTPGTYVVRVEPLDDAEPESFFRNPADVDFRVTYARRPAVVPAGGAGPDVVVEVRPR